MNLLTLITLAFVMGSGAYLMMGFRYSEALLGVALLSNGINLLLIESSQPMKDSVDPLPQALILTAIVIGFGLLTFLAAFIMRRLQVSGSDCITEIDGEDS